MSSCRTTGSRHNCRRRPELGRRQTRTAQTTEPSPRLREEGEPRQGDDPRSVTFRPSLPQVPPLPRFSQRDSPDYSPAPPRRRLVGDGDPVRPENSLRRSREVTHFCSAEMAHTRNTKQIVCRRSLGDVLLNGRGRRPPLARATGCVVLEQGRRALRGHDRASNSDRSAGRVQRSARSIRRRHSISSVVDARAARASE